MKFIVKRKDPKLLLIILLGAAAVLSVIFCVVAMTTDAFAARQEFASLVLYEGPKPLEPSGIAGMEVDGHPLFVYETAVNNGHTWKNDYRPSLSAAPVASFDFAGGSVTMKITVTDPGDEGLGGVVVRPLAYGIQPEVEGNVITFRIDQPDIYTVEYNGSAMNAMYIFANAIDYDAPTASTENVRYIGPGAWDIETMILEDGMDVYISGGAVVRGVMLGNKVSNVKVRGHGFFDGSHHDSWLLLHNTAYVPVNLNNCTDVAISGIALLDPNAWCVNIYNCDNVDLDNVKIITARPNGDGITIQSSRDVTVRNSFIRSWDDSLVVKNYASEKGSDLARVTFDNCQVWTDLAQSMEVGYETNKGCKPKATISDVAFRNITVLHNFHKPVMSIHNADDCEVSGIRYQDIVVEDASMGKGDAGENAQLIEMTIAASSWSSTTTRGTISDVAFDGVYVLDGDDMIDFVEGNFCPVHIEGADEGHLCADITVNDLYLKGEPVTDENVRENQSTSIDKNTANVHFTNTGSLPEALAGLPAAAE